MPMSWTEAVELARAVRDGKAEPVSAAFRLSAYLLGEQEAIDRVKCESYEFIIDVMDDSSPTPIEAFPIEPDTFPTEPNTKPETPKARMTMPMIPAEYEDTDPAVDSEPATGVLGTPDTGVRPRDVLGLFCPFCENDPLKCPTHS